MKSKLLFMTTLALLSFSTVTKAQTQEFIAGGEGCPQSTITYDVSEDQIKIQYHQFHLKSDLNFKILSRSCNIRIPLAVPEGYKAVIDSQTYAFANVQNQSVLQLQQELFFSGKRGRLKSFEITNTASQFELNTKTQSSCGGSFILAINTSLTLLQKQSSKDSLGVIDNTKLGIKFVRCHIVSLK